MKPLISIVLDEEGGIKDFVKPLEGFTLPTVKNSSGPYDRRGCDLSELVKHGLRDQRGHVEWVLMDAAKSSSA